MQQYLIIRSSKADAKISEPLSEVLISGFISRVRPGWLFFRSRGHFTPTSEYTWRDRLFLCNRTMEVNFNSVTKL